MGVINIEGHIALNKDGGGNTVEAWPVVPLKQHKFTLAASTLTELSGLVLNSKTRLLKVWGDSALEFTLGTAPASQTERNSQPALAVVPYLVPEIKGDVKIAARVYQNPV